MNRTKLQISLAIILLGIIGVFALWRGTTEVVTGATSGIVALGMKLLEK